MSSSTRYYKLGSSNEVIETTNEFNIASVWGRSYNVISETIYNTENTSYIINYYDITTSLNITQTIDSTKQRIKIYLIYPNGTIYSGATYGTYELGDRYTYSYRNFYLQTYSLTGYNNLQWNTMSDLSGTNYNLGVQYRTNSSVNFYLNKTANTYTIAYYDGTTQYTGATALSPTIATYNNNYTFPSPTPTKTNYRFNGWYLNSDLTGNVYSGGAQITWTFTENKIFYAKFIINVYDLTYNTNGIGGTSKTFNTVIVGSTPSIPIPKAVGYTFNGWYDSATGGTKKINNDGTGGYTMPAAATILYAQWTQLSDIRLSYLQNTYGIINNDNKISISEYQSSISKTSLSRTALSADFKGKGPVL